MLCCGFVGLWGLDYSVNLSGESRSRSRRKKEVEEGRRKWKTPLPTERVVCGIDEYIYIRRYIVCLCV